MASETSSTNCIHEDRSSSSRRRSWFARWWCRFRIPSKIACAMPFANIGGYSLRWEVLNFPSLSFPIELILASRGVGRLHLNIDVGRCRSLTASKLVGFSDKAPQSPWENRYSPTIVLDPEIRIAFRKLLDMCVKVISSTSSREKMYNQVRRKICDCLVKGQRYFTNFSM